MAEVDALCGIAEAGLARHQDSDYPAIAFENLDCPPKERLPIWVLRVTIASPLSIARTRHSRSVFASKTEGEHELKKDKEEKEEEHSTSNKSRSEAVLDDAKTVLAMGPRRNSNKGRGSTPHGRVSPRERRINGAAFPHGAQSGASTSLARSIVGAP